MTLAGRSRLRLALLGYALAVLVVATLPGGALDRVAPDKVLHAGAYGGLTLLALLAGVPPGWGAAGAVVLSVTHGALVEAVQSFVPWRRAEWGDLGADGIGALAAAVVWVGASRWWRGPRAAAAGDEGPAPGKGMR